MTAPLADLPVSIIGGYLGSGKTTYINQRLNNAGGIRYAVLVNDFGELNIDNQLIATQDVKTIALTNGCVCCSFSGDVGVAMEQVQEFAAEIDWVLLEASGVADPMKLKSLLMNWPGFVLQDCLTLVDVTRIRKLVEDKFVGGHVHQQLVQADKLLLTKKDLCCREETVQITQWLDLIRQNYSADSPVLAHPDYVSETIVLGYPTGRAEFEHWLNEQSPDTIRIKGFVRFESKPYLVQWVDQQWSILPYSSTSAVSTGLVRISKTDPVTFSEK